MKKINKIVYIICIGFTNFCSAMDQSTGGTKERVRPVCTIQIPSLSARESSAPQAPLLKVSASGSPAMAWEDDAVLVREPLVMPREKKEVPSKT